MVSLIDLQLSYVLAFMGQVQIAESLSSTIASTVVGVMLGYFFKALFETFFERREERLKQESEYDKVIQMLKQIQSVKEETKNE